MEGKVPLNVVMGLSHLDITHDYYSQNTDLVLTQDCTGAFSWLYVSLLRLSHLHSWAGGACTVITG